MINNRQIDSALVEYYTNNLRLLYHAASVEDIAEGKDWYANARKELSQISQETGYSLKRICWACAALSNNKSWTENVKLTRKVALALRSHRKPTGHFRVLITKAVRILEHGEFKALSGPKVVAFAEALWKPSSNAAVVDRWMLRAAYNGRPLSNSLGPVKIRRIADALGAVAREVDRPVTEVQAVIWVVIRRLANSN